MRVTKFFENKFAKERYKLENLFLKIIFYSNRSQERLATNMKKVVIVKINNVIFIVSHEN